MRLSVALIDFASSSCAKSDRKRASLAIVLKRAFPKLVGKTRDRTADIDMALWFDMSVQKILVRRKSLTLNLIQISVHPFDLSVHPSVSQI